MKDLRGQAWVGIASLVSILAACGDLAGRAALRNVSQTYVDANVADSQEFDRLLKRNILTFLRSADHDGDSVSVKLLRSDPTQTGTSWPKYYAWIRLTKAKRLVIEGVVRVACIDKKRFDVTHFLTVSQINSTPEQVGRIFRLPWRRTSSSVQDVFAKQKLPGRLRGVGTALKNKICLWYDGDAEL